METPLLGIMEKWRIKMILTTGQVIFAFVFLVVTYVAFFSIGYCGGRGRTR